MNRQKWDFEFPEKSPNVYQKTKLALARANNNLTYGFDGVLTPLQLGPLQRYTRPLLQTEIALATLLLDGDLLGMVKKAVLSGSGIVKDARKARLLMDLHEDSRDTPTET